MSRKRTPPCRRLDPRTLEVIETIPGSSGVVCTYGEPPVRVSTGPETRGGGAAGETRPWPSYGRGRCPQG
jgi:hypothetical protein